MSSPRQEQLALTPLNGGSVRVSSGGKSPLSDESIWRRLSEAGFDEESIRRRDKAALIAYIAKLEAEIHDYQHHMGLLILEKKDWASKYEQVQAAADSAEVTYKLDKASRLSALAEARKREEALKKALAIEKECLANIEKTLHEMRAESAEAKFAAESKMVEACNMLENAQKTCSEAEAKMHKAESLEAEVGRSHRASHRKLEEVKEREDQLRRNLVTFKLECDSKEKELSLERQSLCERQKVVQQVQKRLLDEQTLLNQREEYINGRYQELSRLEKELNTSKDRIEKELKALNEEKVNLDVSLAAFSTRVKTIDEKETQLDKKEQALLSLEEKIARKEYDEIQRLKAVNEATLEMRKSELEAELEQRRRSVEDEIEKKRRACELREVDLCQREEISKEREQELEVEFRALMEKEKDVTERLKALQEKEENLTATEEAKELEKIYMQKEKEEIKNMKLGLHESMVALENKRKEVEEAQEKLESSKFERNELLVLEMKLKDEIDSLRAQKLNLLEEAEELKAEKSKFETEWELIDEKREEIRREADRISEERKEISKFLKDERDLLKVEKETLRNQFKHHEESLSQEREVFTSKMEQEHSEWFSKIQRERANFVNDFELQKRELENCIHKRRDEIERYLREKEEAFEQEKAKELHYISSLKEMIAKEWENVELEKKRLENGRLEISLDRDRREKELAEVKKSIEELQAQKEKLKEQRELLHEDREKINVQIQHLNSLEGLKIASEDVILSEAIEAGLKSNKQNIHPRRRVNLKNVSKDVNLDFCTPKEATSDSSRSGRFFLKQAQDSTSGPSSAISWIKRCTEIIFKQSPEKSTNNQSERSQTECEGAKLLEDKYSQNNNDTLLTQQQNVQGRPEIFEQQISEGKDGTKNIFERVQSLTPVHEELRVILEVPSVENAKCNLESETKTKVPENSIHLYPEEELTAGRKRLNSSSPDNSDVPSKRRRGRRKSSQTRKALEVPFEEESTSDSGLSTQPIPTEDENGLTPFCRTTRNVEEVGDYANGNDKIPIFPEPANVVSAQNFKAVSDQDDDNGGTASDSKEGNDITLPKNTRTRGK